MKCIIVKSFIKDADFLKKDVLLRLFFKQSIFDPHPKNCLVDGLLTSIV